jgi:site-specific recombinase
MGRNKGEKRMKDKSKINALLKCCDELQEIIHEHWDRLSNGEKAEVDKGLTRIEETIERIKEKDL